jgi:hypothetical protein
MEVIGHGKEYPRPNGDTLRIRKRIRTDVTENVISLDGKRETIIGVDVCACDFRRVPKFAGDIRRELHGRFLASDKVYDSSRFIAFVSFVKADRCVIAARDGRWHCCASDKPD